MKTLHNHTIIYDSECPMCDIYTKAFIRTGMLDQGGREPFSETKNNCYKLDLKRASNEIALVNKEDNTITYGIQSLFKVIGNSFPIFKPLFDFRPFQAAVLRLYLFISYNRKVIVPGKSFEGDSSCTPSMNVKYRVLYIGFAWACTSLVLYYYSALLYDFIPTSTFIREFVICGGQIVFQAIVVASLRKDRAIHYLGNLMTISLGGSILLLPMFVLNNFISQSLPFLLYFLFVAGLMLLEHIRRVRILGLPSIISITWIVYRIMVVFIIFAI